MTFKVVSIFILISFFLTSCDKKEDYIPKEVFHGEWQGISNVELYTLNGEFYRDFESGLKLRLLRGGNGEIIRTSGEKNIVWVADSNPDLFIYSEEINGSQAPIPFYFTYIYQIESYSEDELELFREDQYVFNGTEYIRKTYWKLNRQN